MDECLGAVHNPNQLVPTNLRHNSHSPGRTVAVPKQNRFNMKPPPKASIGETLFGGGGGGRDTRFDPAPVHYESAAARRKKARLRQDMAGMPSAVACGSTLVDPKADNISTFLGGGTHHEAPPPIEFPANGGTMQDILGVPTHAARGRGPRQGAPAMDMLLHGSYTREEMAHPTPSPPKKPATHGTFGKRNVTRMFHGDDYRNYAAEGAPPAHGMLANLKDARAAEAAYKAAPRVVPTESFSGEATMKERLGFLREDVGENTIAAPPIEVYEAPDGLMGTFTMGKGAEAARAANSMIEQYPAPALPALKVRGQEHTRAITVNEKLDQTRIRAARWDRIEAIRKQKQGGRISPQDALAATGAWQQGRVSPHNLPGTPVGGGGGKAGGGFEAAYAQGQQVAQNLYFDPSKPREMKRFVKKELPTVWPAGYSSTFASVCTAAPGAYGMHF